MNMPALLGGSTASPSVISVADTVGLLTPHLWGASLPTSSVQWIPRSSNSPSHSSHGRAENQSSTEVAAFAWMERCKGGCPMAQDDWWAMRLNGLSMDEASDLWRPLQPQASIKPCHWLQIICKVKLKVRSIQPVRHQTDAVG